MSSRTPPGLGARGRRLWVNLLEQDPDLEVETNPAREVALEACRTAARLERLDKLCRSVDPIVPTTTGMATHPAFIESRQQANVLKQLIAALRLPDEVSGKRPQYRGPRGAQQPTGSSTVSGGATVSSLERARNRAAGQ